MDKRYKGLSNIGATCYMNSLLQTLFMTPEFRYGIYRWNYNQKIHPKQSDSIIYQLQKLFAKLQTGFPNQLSTKQLVKSFQWEDEEAQMQQDIQEFNRLLFQALEKSLSTKSQNYIHQNFVKDYFEGELIHYTKCHQCLNQSARQQNFQDLIITVKNVYEKVYNHKLQLGLQRYLKPQILDENNLYDCSNCGQKTKAQRGARFIKMPSLLNIIFQRFTFNYFTMERQKINDRVEFPFILNLNDYIEGYEKIPNKLDEDSSAYFKNGHSNGINGKATISKTVSTKQGKVPFLKKSSVPSVAGKTKTKPSANTKSFLAEMRKKKKLNEEMSEDLFFVNGTGVASQNKVENVQNKHKTSKQEMKQQFENSTVDNNNNKNQMEAQNDINQVNNESSKISNNDEKVETNGHVSNNNNLPINNNVQIPPLSMNIPPPPPLFIVPESLSIPYKLVDTENHQSIESQLQKKQLQSQKLQKEKEKELHQLQQKNKQLIQKYLKQGPLVYELYAVLVHNGTANHGHYYCYIKSFQDNNWYCFNDEKVTVINVLEIQKTFGNGNSNAYALYYRMVDQQSYFKHTESNIINNINNKTDTSENKTLYSSQFLQNLKVSIPSYIKQRLEQQKSALKQKEQMKVNNLQNLIILKICHQLYVKQIQLYKSNTLDLALQKAREIFNIGSQVKKENTRLRLFNPATQTKLETFGGKGHLSLQQLKIGSYKSLLLEIKGDNDQFEQYEIGSVFVRVALIQENKNVNSLDESCLKLHKICIKRNQTVESILETLKEKRMQILQSSNLPSIENDGKNQRLCLIKRHQNNDEAIHEIISVKQNLNKTIDDLNILENQILFVEPQSQQLIWPQEFQNEIYRISIRYNKPSTNEYITYLTDSRIKLKQLKAQLCTFLEISPDQLILKWGTKSGRELKDLQITLKQARFITGTQLYLDYGIPAQPNQIRIQLFLATDAANNVFNRLHEFQYITDVPISGLLKASEVKLKFIPVLKKFKVIQLQPQQFRIRQRVSQKIGKIYRQKPMKQQQLIQKRQIAIELIPDQNLDIKDFSIYFRVWDQLNWELSQKVQIVVNKNTTMKELSELISVNPLNKVIKQPHNMCICRILSIHKFNIIDLTEMEWFTMEQDVSVLGEPMFVNADGLLYIVKNGNQEPRALTKQEEKKFGGTLKPAVIRNRPKVYSPKEGKSMKIKVIQKQIEPQQIPTENHVQSKTQNNDVESKMSNQNHQVHNTHMDVQNKEKEKQ